MWEECNYNIEEHSYKCPFVLFHCAKKTTFEIINLWYQKTGALG